MNDKEIREIRRRFQPDKSAVSMAYGCYVNENKKIVTMFEEAITVMPEEDAERFLGLFKKSISGSLGRNLVNLPFSAKQVMESEQHKMLSVLRQSELKDDGVREAFFHQVAEHMEMETGYVILLAHDVYNVPFKAKDDITLDDLADEEFRYFVCAICPVKQPAPGLGLNLGENKVRSTFQGLVLGAPEVGFMFPAFDDRATNIYGLLYHTKNTAQNHPELIGNLFGIEPPMPAAEQMATFQTVLAQSLQEDCSLEVVQAVHGHIAAMIEAHKENKEPEQLLLSKKDVSAALADCGVSEERISAFEQAFDGSFGEDAMLPPENILDGRQFVIRTEDTTIKVAPEQSAAVETRVIDGRKYILIPAGGEVEVNGIEVRIEAR